MSGPASAINSSCIGRAASRVICATPPNTNRVMLFTGILKAFATTLCPSSCSTIDAKKTSTLAAAIA